MAEESARPVPGRKKAAKTDAAKATEKKAARAKPAARKAPATPRARRAPAATAEPTREAIAEHAYLLWERGEPGGEEAHWLRAEAELRAA